MNGRLKVLLRRLKKSHRKIRRQKTALQRAKEAAGGEDVRLGGGVATIRQYLSAGLLDELHLAISPVVLGEGEHLLAGIHLPNLGYECVEFVAGENATHVVLSRVA
jgi:dihydrofolate reductase